jgi:nucleoside-diphosphate-sugar epimerase
MNVLVTGSHGYIGSVTAAVLQEAGHDVTGLDALFNEGCDLEAAPDEVRTLQLDIRDVTPDQLEGFDAVVHLAALSNDPLGELNPALTREINLEGTMAVARSAKAAGVRRFVFSSSCSMYGASGLAAADETAPLQPLTAYAESKARAEEALAALADAEFSPVFMRNATAHGVSPRLRVDLVLNNLVAWAHTTGEIRVLSDGTPWRPLIHVRDIARATVAILEAPAERVHNEAFNVGADAENYQVRDLAEVVAEVAGCSTRYAGAGDPDSRSYRVDFGKFTRAFPELRLEWTARAGAEELLDAYRRSNLTRADLDGTKFVRLNRLTQLLASGDLDSRLRWAREAPVA